MRMKVLFVVLVAISSHIVCLDWRLPTLGILLSVANNDIITPAPEPEVTKQFVQQLPVQQIN